MNPLFTFENTIKLLKNRESEVFCVMEKEASFIESGFCFNSISDRYQEVFIIFCGDYNALLDGCPS